MEADNPTTAATARSLIMEELPNFPKGEGTPKAKKPNIEATSASSPNTDPDTKGGGTLKVL